MSVGNYVINPLNLHNNGVNTGGKKRGVFPRLCPAKLSIVFQGWLRCLFATGLPLPLDQNIKYSDGSDILSSIHFRNDSPY